MKNRDECYKYFLEKWGIDSQIVMCLEEMNELGKELCKYIRYTDKDCTGDIVKNIKEELADVLNMCEQLAYHFGTQEIEDIRDFKIDRTIKRINNN